MDNSCSPRKSIRDNRTDKFTRQGGLLRTLKDMYYYNEILLPLGQLSPPLNTDVPHPYMFPNPSPTLIHSSDNMKFSSNIGLSEKRGSGNNSEYSSGNAKNVQTRMKRLVTLPLWTLDENGEIRKDLTLQDVVNSGLLICFAMDKSGCHFLQSNFYGENTQHIAEELRDKICMEVLGSSDVFLNLCRNIFGNFFVQRVIEYSRPHEQEYIRKYINYDITELCLDKSACRVVQTALEKLKLRHAESMICSIPKNEDLLSICNDQNANHVIQKIVKKFPLKKWEFLVNFLCRHDKDFMLVVCQDKYGCRVVQTVVEVLSMDHPKNEEVGDKIRVLKKLMSRILMRCPKLASNEYANYVIQHIIETPGVLGPYRDSIIERCLLRNLLSLSQEKYASHVVERAFVYAPLPLLEKMMMEMFDGYVPHPETGKDALDILIFHQFGNYVVQRMLRICCSAVLGQKDTVINGVDCRDKFEDWLKKLYARAQIDRHRLTRFSSGKKILEILAEMEKIFTFSSSNDVSLFENSFFTSSSTKNEWRPRNNSLSSDCHDYNLSGFHGRF